MKTRNFDLVLSLGMRCFASMLLRQNNLQVTSFPFDWLLSSKYKQNLEFLCNNFENFINKEDLILAENEGNEFHNTYKNTRFGFSFVHDFPVDVDFDIQFEVVKAKYNKRSARLVDKIKNSKTVLFVYLDYASSFTQENKDEIVKDTREMISRLKEVYPDTEFSFMFINTSDNSFNTYVKYDDINLEIIEQKALPSHSKVKFLGLSFSKKVNIAPETLRNCRLNKTPKEKFDNFMYWVKKIGRRFLPKKLKSYFAERKY